MGQTLDLQSNLLICLFEPPGATGRLPTPAQRAFSWDDRFLEFVADDTHQVMF